jgi:NAD(P)-dependent dehydrogenase (short-subunit alcohol dehydrogenase family)
MMRLVLPIMRDQASGRIVNITAIGAIFATPLYSAYCASKHALDSISAGADIDVRSFGVRVISVLPGQFKTSIAEKRLQSGLSAPYQALSDAMARARAKRTSDVLTELSPVVNATIEAATHPDPKPRYVVGKGMADMVAPAVAELHKLYEFDMQRAEYLS